MTEPKSSQEKYQDLMNKWDAEAKASAAAARAPKKKKVKDAIKAKAKQGFGGLNINTRKLLDQVED